MHDVGACMRDGGVTVKRESNPGPPWGFHAAAFCLKPREVAFAPEKLPLLLYSSVLQFKD